MSVLQDKKAAYHTLGCKLNFAETSSLRDRLESLGVKTIEKGEQADICIVNTCSVTDVADHKCRQAIHRFTREHPGAFVAVIGCYAQLKTEEIAQFEGSYQAWRNGKEFINRRWIHCLIQAQPG